MLTQKELQKIKDIIFYFVTSDNFVKICLEIKKQIPYQKSYHEQFMDLYHEIKCKCGYTITREQLYNYLKELSILHDKAMEEKDA